MLDITKPFILPVKIYQIRSHGIWTYKTHQPAATRSERNQTISFDLDLISANVNGIVVSSFFFSLREFPKLDYSYPSQFTQPIYFVLILKFDSSLLKL